MGDKWSGSHKEWDTHKVLSIRGGTYTMWDMQLKSEQDTHTRMQTCADDKKGGAQIKSRKPRTES